MAAICSHCNQVIVALTGSAVQTTIGNTRWPTVVYHCSLCFKAISAQIDPTVIQQQMMDEIQAMLRRMHSGNIP